MSDQSGGRQWEDDPRGPSIPGQSGGQSSSAWTRASHPVTSDPGNPNSVGYPPAGSPAPQAAQPPVLTPPGWTPPSRFGQPPGESSGQPFGQPTGQQFAPGAPYAQNSYAQNSYAQNSYAPGSPGMAAAGAIPPGQPPFAPPGQLGSTQPTPYAPPGWTPTQAPGQRASGYQAPGQQWLPASGNPYSGMWMNHKPGIVALRPMSVGDVLGAALSLVRFNPKATLGLACIVQGLALLVTLVGVAITRSSSAGIGTNGQVDRTQLVSGTLPIFGGSLLSSFCSILLAGLLAYVCGEAVLGRKASLGETWRMSRGRMWPFLACQLLLMLAGLVAYGAVAALGFLTHSLGGSTGTVIAVVLISLLAVCVLAVWIGVRLLLTGPAIVLERLGVRGGIARSWQLTRTGFWRILGAYVAASLLAGMATSMLATPVQLVTGGVVAASNGTTALATTMALTAIAQCVAMILVAPFSAGVTCLLYLDQRIRSEGFDITLQTSADQGSSPWPTANQA